MLYNRLWREDTVDTVDTVDKGVYRSYTKKKKEIKKKG